MPHRPSSQPDSAITLRPTTPADRFLIRRWLSQPHVAAWLGSTAAAEASVAIAADMPSAICRVIERNAIPVGYAHAFDDDGHHPITLTRTTDAAGATPPLPSGTWLTEIFVADTAERGQGTGTAALKRLCAEVFATTLAPAIALRVSIRHERQMRSLERAGFAWHAIIADPLLGPAWLLTAHRTPPRLTTKAPANTDR